MKKTTGVWEFVEAYYPNYSSCDEIMRNNDLQKQIEEGEQTEEDLKEQLNDSNAYIYGKAIEGYIQQQNELRFNTVLNVAKAEILEDIKTKLVPRTVTNFSELHDYVDANCYGRFCEDGYEASEGYEFENSIQYTLDEWLKNGRK